jgi:Periplasmic binding protein
MTTINRSERVGVITDQTGALSFTGIANVNVAKMVIDDLNDRGGLLGRPVELFVEDSATDDSMAEVAAARLVERAVDVVVGRHLQLDATGHQVTRGRPSRDVVHLPGAVRRSGVSPPDLLHRAGAGAAGRALLPLADAAGRGEALLHALGRLHLVASNEPLTGRVGSSIAGSPS